MQGSDLGNGEAALLATVLETAPVVILVRDERGRIVRFNRLAETLSGIDSEEALGKTLWELVLAAEDAEAAQVLFAQALAGDATTRKELQWFHRDGTSRTVLWRTVRCDGPDGTVYVVSSGLDVTEQREAESAALRRLDELAAMYRLHTANELGATLAHELNQPLAAIATLSEACLRAARTEAPPLELLRANLEKIGTQSLRAGRFINELRRFVAQGELPRSLVDLNALLRSAATLAAPYAQRHGVRILLGQSEGLPPVEAAEIQIEHVIINLLRNAVEAVVGAGMVSGEVRMATAKTSDGMARVTVSDSGPGVNAEDAEQLFKPFYSTKPSGLGMGLRVSRTIVEAHGGRLWAEPGAAGTFCFTLPFAP